MRHKEVERKEVDLLKGYVIMLRPDKDSPQWLYLKQADIYEDGTVTDSVADITDAEGNMQPHIFETQKEATAIKNLLQGTVTDLDAAVLTVIGNNPGITFDKLYKGFASKKVQQISDCVNKFQRNLSIEVFKKVGYKITPNGVGTLRRFKYGDRCMVQTPYKVVSMEEVLKGLNSHKTPEGKKLF